MKSSWLVGPSLVIIGIWASVYDPRLRSYTIPIISKFEVLAPVKAEVPGIQLTFSEVWRLAGLQRDVVLNSTSSDKEQILKEVAQILHLNTTLEETEKVLNTLHTLISEDDVPLSPIRKLIGMLTVVNIMWLLAIIGIAISILPALLPMVDLLHRIAWEVLMFLDRWHVIEAFSYLLCLNLIVGSLNHPGTVGILVSTTGASLMIPAMIYATSLHITRLSDVGTTEISTVLLGILLPLAVHFQSTFLGFAAVVSLYSALKFSVVPYGLSYYVGFRDEQSMHNISCTSAILLGVSIVTKACGISSMWISPFVLGLNVMGCITLCISQLIQSSWLFTSRKTDYVDRQLRMILTLSVCICAGLFLHMPSLLHTAYTFGILYLVDKYLDFHRMLEWSGWLAILVVSLVMWRVALWLSVNPGFFYTLAGFEAM